MDKIKREFSTARAVPVAILGVPFDNITIAEAIDLIERMVVSRRPHYLATANVDFLVQASRDVELRRILFDAHLVLCDGTPLVWASRLLGNPLPERVAGSDIVPLLLKLSAEKGYRPFFLGASEDSALKAMENIKEQYPGIQFAGYYSPPFNKLQEMDHNEIRRRILEAKPDFLFVGFGCPKQEKWITMHYRSLGVPVSVGVGATIDFLAGKVSRAPRWMQKSGTEWIFRLLQEPRRLAKRYFNDLWYFGAAIVRQYVRFRLRKNEKSGRKDAAPIQCAVDYNLLEMPAYLDCEEVRRQSAEADIPIEGKKALFADLSKVDFIDSTGVGFLIRLAKKARFDSRPFFLINPSDCVKRGLSMMRLEEFFSTAANVEDALERVAGGWKASPVQLQTSADRTSPALVWKDELTAANAEEVWNLTQQHLMARALVQRSIVIDLSGLRFMDSSGLGVMIRTKKIAARQNLELRFEGAQPSVLNVIRLSQLQDYLLPKDR